MARYVQVHPEYVVELFFYDPATDTPESPVAPEKDADGNTYGRIHQVDGEGTLTIKPGMAYWRVVEIDGSPVIGSSPWHVNTAAEVELGFDELLETPEALALPADTEVERETVPETKSGKKGWKS